MTRLLLTLCLLLSVPGWAWAADAGTETLYAKVCANNGDGSAQTCAGSPGGVGAFSSLANVLFDNAANTAGKVDRGDTLYICGAHPNSQLDITAEGTSSTTMITIDGNCPGDAGSIDAGANGYGLRQFNSITRYVKITNLTIVGGSVAGIHCNGANGECRGNVYSNNTITAGTACGGCSVIAVRGPRETTVSGNTIDAALLFPVGIKLDANTAACAYPTCGDNLITGNTVTRAITGAIRFNGVSAAAVIEKPGIISNNTVYGNGDGIYPVWASGVIVTGNTSYGNNVTSGSGEGNGFACQECPDPTFTSNTSYNNRLEGIHIYAADTQSPYNFVVIKNNLVYDNNTGATGAFMPAIFLNQVGASVNMPNTVVTGNVVRGSTIGIESLKGVTGVIANNTVSGATVEGCIYISTNAANLTIQNNLLSCGTIKAINTSDSGLGANVAFKNNYIDTTGTVAGSTVLARLASTNYTSSNISSFDSTTLTGAASFINSTGLDYRIPASITNIRRAGRDGYLCSDKRGRPCYHPPDIGAYQATSRDQAATRAPRQ